MLREQSSSVCTNDFMGILHPREQNFHPAKCFMIFNRLNIERTWKRSLVCTDTCKMSLEHGPGAKPFVCIGLKSHPLVVLSQMCFSFKCPNELVPPYLSDYFIRNRTFHTYKTKQSNDIHLPNPKLTLGKKETFKFLGAVLLNNLPTWIKEATSLSIYKNFLSFHFSH